MGGGQDDLGRRAPGGPGGRLLTDTIFALSSGRPPCAVAVIRTSGPNAFATAEALCGPLPPPRQAALRDVRLPASDLPIDQVLLLRFDRPASATGEDVVEYQCHGGRAVIDAMLHAIGSRPGMRAAEPGEFTRRAFANGRIDLTEAEGLADLLEAETESQRRAALRNAEGGLRRQIEAWRARVIDLSARAEAAIDYVGDEEETGGDDRGLATEPLALADELAGWLARPRVETLKDGVRVVVAGPPNAGKSSLINRIAGIDKSIVTSIPGTTRDVIEVPVAIGGVPLVLVDTAGLRPSDDPVERIGIGRAETEMRGGDLLLWLGEPTDAPDHANLLLIHPRADLPGREPAAVGSLAVSSMTGDGMQRLVQAITERASFLLPADDLLTLNRRQAEWIGRAEQALRDASFAALEVVADALRRARECFDHVVGRAGVEEMLDSLFGRFCLGK